MQAGTGWSTAALANCRATDRVVTMLRCAYLRRRCKEPPAQSYTDSRITFWVLRMTPLPHKHITEYRIQNPAHLTRTDRLRSSKPGWAST